jgi:hypothetical protein
MLFTAEVLKGAYDALVSVVRDFELRGQPCYGALLKPQFLRRTGFTGRDSNVGFPRFGEFLRSAEAAGFIRITTRPKQDLQVSLPGSEPSSDLWKNQASLALQFSPGPPQSTAVAEAILIAPVRVRPDLWRAFNATSEDWYYDVDKDLAQRHLHASAFGSKNDRLIPIPFARQRILEWMKDFSEVQEPEAKASLLRILEAETSPSYRFENFVRHTPLLRSWRRYHVQQIVAAIEAWASANGVRPRDVVTPLQKSYETTRPLLHPPFRNETLAAPSLPAQAAERTEANQVLTGRLAILIDQMIDELAKLRGFIELTNQRR